MSLRKFISTCVWMVVGGIVGWLINSATVGKYNVINATCSVINTAVENKFIPQDQVRALGQASQKLLLDTAAGDAFQLDEQKIQAASNNSNCSQFMVGMSSH